MTGEDDRSASTTLSIDACLELLANRQRRTVVSFFLDADVEHAPVDELVTEIIDAEAATTGTRPGRDTVEATLFHVHLPKFANAGIVEYDTRHVEVRYHGNDRIETLYRKISEVE